MEVNNVDSDHSMTWEDFFGSTTDLTPTLIGIYDSLLVPGKLTNDQVTKYPGAKDLENDNGNLNEVVEESVERTFCKSFDSENSDIGNGSLKLIKNPNKIPGQKFVGQKLGNVSEFRVSDALNSDNTYHSVKTVNDTNGKDRNISENTEYSNGNSRKSTENTTTTSNFENLSPNVKRLISSASDKTTHLIMQPKRNPIRSSLRKTNIPLVGATSKISQSGLEIVDSVDIYDSSKFKLKKPDVNINKTQQDVIYDVPKVDKSKDMEALSLPFIDQSIDPNINDQSVDPSIDDREFDTKPTPRSDSNVNDNSDANDKKSSPKLLTSEVQRPLSLSSLASSSSTSSGGPTRAGANSAYLASIESLDDHSDADHVHKKRENIVNDGVSSAQVMMTQLELVCAEIVHTENVYVEDLRQVVVGYLHAWKEEGLFTDDELNELFSNIEDIYMFNKLLCQELNVCGLDAEEISRCFVRNTAGFHVYTSYCTNYPTTMQRLTLLAKSKQAVAFRETQLRLNHPLPLNSYLLKPVQRILKYHLLLQKLVEHHQSAETQYALTEMTDIAHHIDNMKKKHEHDVRVQEIQSLLYGWNGPDLTTYGELCAEGTFRVFGAKAMRHVFLFDKMLLLTKNREDGILAYKSHIQCSNLMLVESLVGAPLSFQVIPYDSPRGHVTLLASTARHKREWTLLLKRVILENYHAVIPSHARQLVMELGQNKTDDDILAEKSHQRTNLITQASMRKQMSAPEYLEKRKLERERRKAFDNRSRVKKNRKQVDTSQEICDCAQLSDEKGVDYICEHCYVELCTYCESEIKNNASVKNRCAECDRNIHYIDSASNEHLERKQNCYTCSDLNSEEVIGKPLRGYHSTDNIMLVNAKSTDELDRIQKICVKCEKIKENIVSPEFSGRRSRFIQNQKRSSIRSRSKDDPQRSRLPRLGWRRKSEPGLQQEALENKTIIEENENTEKIEFECRNCGSNKIMKRNYSSLPRVKENKDFQYNTLDVKMYNSKHMPKKITKIKKNKAKAKVTTEARFYTDFPDLATDEILHISESTDSINTLTTNSPNKDGDIDEETYKKLIEKTDSFKKNELDKVKYLNQHKSIDENENPDDSVNREDLIESGDESEKPLEQIISQLLLENKELQKILKKQQLRNTNSRRKLLKSYSIPPDEHDDSYTKFRRYSEDLAIKPDERFIKEKTKDDDHIYETLRVLDANDHKTDDAIKHRNHSESDYVYLTFDKVNASTDVKNETIYDVPVTANTSISKPNETYYVPIEIKEKNVIPVDRKNETSDYIAMNKDQNPVNPEIWVTRQKEHFVASDRKSGSLPRSFQVPIETEFTSKVYNRKVGIDRPFTIASDKAEITYDQYMNDENKLSTTVNSSFNNDDLRDVSKSTLELEEEIEKCYKSNIDKSNDNLLPMSQPDLDSSVTSSCEAISYERPKETISIHPEHKIYKPTTNFSLRNILNHFKSKNSKTASNPNISQGDDDKKTSLNPKRYLLRRFKSIINDDSIDNTSKTFKDISSTNNELLSKSANESTSQIEVGIDVSSLSEISKSCDNLKRDSRRDRPIYDKSISMIANNTNYVSSGLAKAVNSCNNKLPVYKQGSKNLGAKIAFNDYLDPKKLCIGDSNVNVLINKNSVKNDSIAKLSTNDDLKKHDDNDANITQGDVSDKCFYEKSFEQIEHYSGNFSEDDKDISPEKKLNAEINKDENILTESCSVKERITMIKEKYGLDDNIKLNTQLKTIKTKLNTIEKPKIHPKNVTLNTKLSPRKRTNGTVNNIQLKRLSFERASFDSIENHNKSIAIKRNNGKISKSVLERRLELESLANTSGQTNANVKLTKQISAEGRVDFRRGTSEPVEIIDKNYLDNADEVKGSWVKQVVNKFQ